ncbi:MAG: hypothetical protein Q9182_002028 [Xanthomendoza sp. 2 TL-2023]
MAPSTVHLPNGQTLTVSPVFGGFQFKSNDLNVHNSAFPPGWTIFIESKDDVDDDVAVDGHDSHHVKEKSHVRRFRNPTLHGDNFFFSSISSPSNIDFKPATSPTRQIAMMLWATLWWYFHQPKPNPHITTKGLNEHTPEDGKPKGDWRIGIKRDGIFKGRHLLPKLERMGIITSEESCVGESIDDKHGEGWTRMFASERGFWFIDPRIFLFTLSPTTHSPFPGTSPYPSRPSSPNRDTFQPSRPDSVGEIPQGPMTPQTQSPSGPFASGSHLPTYYPPPPTLFTFTNNIRHPIRQKPPAQGETFYTRYVPSVGQFLSFRVASLSPKAPLHRGPVSDSTPSFLPPGSGVTQDSLPSIASMTINPSDTDLLHVWMNDPRVDALFAMAGPRQVQEKMLRDALNDKHSFPVIGCWDGKPFGFFEIYWVKEDRLGRYLSSHDYGNWDRGFHALVGEQEFRGPHRVKLWISALVHYCWLADSRTERVLVEPRIDHLKFINYLQDVGFYKEREIAFPHKQAALMKIRREGWEAPAL